MPASLPARSTSCWRRALGVEAGPVVLPRLGQTAAPGRIDDGVVTVQGLAAAAAAGGGVLQVACRDDDHRVVLATADGLDRRAIGGLDPALGLVEVTGQAPGHEFWPGSVDPGVDEIGPEVVGWQYAVASGQRALAHELIGASAAMLDLAREHAVERIQFGVPIASFQAVRHRLADCLVAVESSRAALDAAWEAGSAFDAAIAKAIAGRGARLVAKHAQQVLAGVGFTLEHPLHRYVRRVRLLDGLLGDARSLTRALGEQLLRDGGLPDILPL